MGTKSCIFGCIFAAECAQISQHTPILLHTKRLKNSRTEVAVLPREPACLNSATWLNLCSQCFACIPPYLSSERFEIRE